MAQLVTYDEDNPRPRPSTRLQEGMLVKCEGVVWRVGLANECRARLDPITRVKRVIEHYDKKTGEETTKEIEVFPASINVSPNSEIEILEYDDKSKKSRPDPRATLAAAKAGKHGHGSKSASARADRSVKETK
jgi:hypothetical protein